MNYRDMMASTAEIVQDAGVATKILQHMDRIRNNKSEESARRWVWELIQNAKDVARDGSPVHIKIERTPNELFFSHDGKPFRIKNVLSLINQISSKTNDEESTGMFGTGFITTHQLSPVVTLRSVIQDKIVVDGIAHALPYKAFEVMLDRSGEDIDAITASVKASLDVIRRLDDSPDVAAYQPEAYNTQLRYALETQDAKEIAQKGLADLTHSIFYALIFVDNIATVTVVEEGVQTVYRKGDVTPVAEHLSEHVLYRNSEAFRFLSASSDGTMIALPVASDEKRLLSVNENTPKLSVDFPLIGSEQFPLPYVCNSHALHPSEKRNWVPISVNSTKISDQKLLDKRVLLRASMFGYDNEAVASKILNTVDRLLSQGELVKQAETHQEACARLLAWINENPDGATKYFPSFASEEARMRLMSSKTASILNKKVRAMEQVLQDAGVGSVEALADMLRRMQENEATTDAPDDETYDDGKIAIGEGDDYYWALAELEQQAYVRKVGTTGEELVFELLKNSYLERGFALTAQSPTMYQLEQEGVQVVLKKPDTACYKQKGYDISETITQNGESTCCYYEVKATTDRIRSHVFRLSNAQFNLALSAKERFTVVFVYLIPQSLQLSFIVQKENFFAQMQQNDVRCLNEAFFVSA